MQPNKSRFKLSYDEEKWYCQNCERELREWEVIKSKRKTEYNGIKNGSSLCSVCIERDPNLYQNYVECGECEEDIPEDKIIKFNGKRVCEECFYKWMKVAV